MNFCWVTIRVKDMEASVRFYHEILGLHIYNRYHVYNTEVAMLGEKDAPKIELLHDADTPVHSYEDSQMSIGFEVPSIDDSLAYMESHGIPVAFGPFSPAPDIRFYYVHDPDHVRIQLVEKT